jgi:hypothetical protein
MVKRSLTAGPSCDWNTSGHLTLPHAGAGIVGFAWTIRVA